MDATYKQLVHIYDEHTAATLQRQVLDPTSKYVWWYY